MELPARKTADLLLSRGLKLSVAESCTGGLLGATLTDVSGSSEWFVGGVIAYSNELKEALLGVSREVLKTHGAVSSETAMEMAEGAKRATGSDVAIAITGIAGPTGGTPEKPVGTVFVAITDGRRTKAERFQFQGSRREIREKTVLKALEIIEEFVSST